MMQKRLQEVCKPIGLKFASDRSFVPNTIMAHLLTEYAETHGGIAKQNEVADRLLTEFFGHGTNLDKDFLVKVASDVGLDTQEVAMYITNPQEQQNLKRKARAWSEKGCHGVPFFIMNGRPTFSGAQEPDVFKSTILKIAKVLPLKTDGEKETNSCL